MQRSLYSESQSPPRPVTVRPVRVIIEFSSDLKELRTVFLPGKTEEEDRRIETLIREKFWWMVPE